MDSCQKILGLEVLLFVMLRGRCRVTSPPRWFSHKFVRAFLFSVVKPKSTLFRFLIPSVGDWHKDSARW